jgi:hypothetical protein
MVGTQRLLAIAMVCLLVGISVQAKPDVLGIIVGSNAARLGAHSASEGTSVYDGDRLSTEAGGALRLRSGASMLYLAEESCVVIHRNSGGAGSFGAELVSGQVVLLVPARSGSEVVARGATVAADSNGAAIVQVKVIGAKELVIFVRRGRARVSYREQTEIIAEGKTVRVVLDPMNDGASNNQGAKPPRGHGKAFEMIVVGGAAAAAIIIPLIYGQRYESPDRP